MSIGWGGVVGRGVLGGVGRWYIGEGHGVELGESV